MHVMKTACQVLYAVTALAWSAIGLTIHGMTIGGTIFRGVSSVVAVPGTSSSRRPAFQALATTSRIFPRTNQLSKSSVLAFASHSPTFSDLISHRKYNIVSAAPASTSFSSPLPKSRSLKMSSSSTSTPSNDASVQRIKNRIALLQFLVTTSKSQNIQTAQDNIQKAYREGARLCVLPEIWNSPYATSAFGDYAEILPKVGDSLSDVDGEDGGNKWGPSSLVLMEMAKKTGMYIVGGSIPEVDNDKIYNTCLIVHPQGKIIGKHRKVHLFDINVPGGVCFRESETLSAGEGITYFDVDDGDGGLGRIGVGICYDIRFPEYSLLLTQTHKCKILIYPGAFNLTTGPAHWELLSRARAVDGQCYVLVCSPARMPPPPEEDDDKSTTKKYPHYSAWGHSTVVSPWGNVIATCDENPSVVVADLDMEKVDEMRMAIPTMDQKRDDLYRLMEGCGDT